MVYTPYFQNVYCVEDVLDYLYHTWSYLAAVSCIHDCLKNGRNCQGFPAIYIVTVVPLKTVLMQWFHTFMTMNNIVKNSLGQGKRSPRNSLLFIHGSYFLEPRSGDDTDWKYSTSPCPITAVYTHFLEGKH